MTYDLSSVISISYKITGTASYVNPYKHVPKAIRPFLERNETYSEVLQQIHFSTHYKGTTSKIQTLWKVDTTVRKYQLRPKDSNNEHHKSILNFTFNIIYKESLNQKLHVTRI